MPARIVGFSPVNLTAAHFSGDFCVACTSLYLTSFKLPEFNSGQPATYVSLFVLLRFSAHDTALVESNPTYGEPIGDRS